jgi:diguanylate cyclase
VLNSLFLNACIMVALSTIAYHLFIGKNHLKNMDTVRKLGFGVYCGLAAVMLMVNSFQVEPGVIMDLRNFAVVIAAIFGGPISAFLTAAMIIVCRMEFWEVTRATIVASAAITVIFVLCSVVSAMSLDFKRKWILCSVINVAVGTAGLSNGLHDSAKLLPALAYFIIGTAVASGFLYFLLMYYIAFHNLQVRLVSESTKDFLTGINNVRAFNVEFNKLICRASRNQEKLSFMLVDLDHFKKVNDRYGHAAGDLVLKTLASLLCESCRVFDIVSRNGGEEFSVILQDCPPNRAVEVAERFRKTVERNVFKLSDGREINITVSIGVATYREQCRNSKELVALADKALYHAKETGRNKTVLYDDIHKS